MMHWYMTDGGTIICLETGAEIGLYSICTGEHIVKLLINGGCSQRPLFSFENKEQALAYFNFLRDGLLNRGEP